MRGGLSNKPARRPGHKDARGREIWCPTSIPACFEAVAVARPRLRLGRRFTPAVPGQGRRAAADVPSQPSATLLRQERHATAADRPPPPNNMTTIHAAAAGRIAVPTRRWFRPGLEC